MDGLGQEGKKSTLVGIIPFPLVFGCRYGIGGSLQMQHTESIRDLLFNPSL